MPPEPMVRMSVDLALAAGHGQGWRQVGELLLAFGLSALIGLERQMRGKAAGLRTQTIVGTTAALMLLVSKYGFADVLVNGEVMLDPSRVAAQIVSGIGFLGAGLILTRQGAVRGLTTAAAVWETAGIGMAAGAGLPLLAGLVVVLHFTAVFGFTALVRVLPGSRTSALRLRVHYLDGRGVLRNVMSASTSTGWRIDDLSPEDATESEYRGTTQRTVAVTIGLAGSGQQDDLLAKLGDLDGVLSVARVSAEEFD
ncbi:MAG: MgtC/SapB family protein [Mycobacteriales bacterium]